MSPVTSGRFPWIQTLLEDGLRRVELSEVLLEWYAVELGNNKGKSGEAVGRGAVRAAYAEHGDEMVGICLVEEAVDARVRVWKTLEPSSIRATGAKNAVGHAPLSTIPPRACLSSIFCNFTCFLSFRSLFPFSISADFLGRN